MKKDEELWLKKIKERLEDHSEPLPDAGWERLEKALPASAPIAVNGGRRLMMRRWGMTAAAVTLVAVSSVSLWLMQSPVVDDVRRSAEPVYAAMPDAMPEAPEPAIGGEQVEPVIRRVIGADTPNRHRPLVAQRLEAEDNEVETEDALTETGNTLPEAGDVSRESEDSYQNAEAVSQNAEDASSKVEKNAEKKSERTAVYRPSGKDKLHLPAEKKSDAAKKGWAVGLSLGNTGGSSMLNDGDGADFPLNNQGTPMFGDKVDLTTVSNGIMGIPGGQEIVFEDGVPYLRRNTPQVKDIKHKQPISVGISVRKALPKNFSVETGLTYTFLSSEITYEGSSEKADQKLHYIGIPVRANWNFVNRKRFTAYVSAGGAIEKCVYGKVASETETVKPVQLSVMGAVGAQYNVSNRVGIYIEPGISYFFDDGSKIETIRKENPTNFTLQAGVRLTY